MSSQTLATHPPGSALRSRLIYRPSLRRWRTHPVLRELATQEAEQWLPAEEIHLRQQARLIETVCHAVATVPFYRQRLQEVGVDAAALRLPSDLQRLPLLRREDLCQHRLEMVAAGPREAGAVWNHTGGSTGQPVSFLQEDGYRHANLACTARHDRWSGWDFGMRTALLWGADRDLARRAPWRQRLETRWLWRQVELDAFEMGPAQMAGFAAELRRFRPQWMRGYASALALFAKHLEAQGRPFPPPCAVVSCAETLGEAERELIERVFEAPVFDRYGSREFGVIASQCEAGSYHINTRGVYVEILDGNRAAAPGTVGRVVITGLAARAMPLVRYETGDVARVPTASGCPCGRGLPLLGAIVGRSSEFIATADGRLVHGEFFTHLFYGSDSVESFSVVQDRSGELTLSLVGDGERLEQEANRAVAAIRERCGASTVIHAQHLDRIPASPSGKRCFVRSEMAAARWSAGRGSQVCP